MKNGQTILESTYFRGFEYCRTFVLSGSPFSFRKIPVFDRWMLKNKKIKFVYRNTFLTDRALQTEVRQKVRQRPYASPGGSRIVVSG